MCVQTPCKDIPPNSIVFALGFLYLGEKDGVIIPGQANAQLAQVLERCADRFSLVLTQKAISDTLAPVRPAGREGPLQYPRAHIGGAQVRAGTVHRGARVHRPAGPSQALPEGADGPQGPVWGQDHSTPSRQAGLPQQALAPPHPLGVQEPTSLARGLFADPEHQTAGTGSFMVDTEKVRYPRGLSQRGSDSK